ncbi:MAG: hypothetical protein QW559_03520 [Candidatus Woesearchaeota archaeon]
MTSSGLLVHIILSVLALSGIFTGYLLGSLTREELPSGQRYFKLLQSFLLATILFILLKSSGLAWIASVASAAALLLLSIFFVLPLSAVYAFFIIALYTAYKLGIFLELVFLTFLYGLPAGSLLFLQKGKKLLKSFK